MPEAQPRVAQGQLGGAARRASLPVQSDPLDHPAPARPGSDRKSEPVESLVFVLRGEGAFVPCPPAGSCGVTNSLKNIELRRGRASILQLGEARVADRRGSGTSAIGCRRSSGKRWRLPWGVYCSRGLHISPGQACDTTSSPSRAGHFLREFSFDGCSSKKMHQQKKEKKKRASLDCYET